MARGGKPGPKAVPTNVVQLRGNPGKRKRAPEPRSTAAALTPPTWLELTPTAVIFWKKHAPELSKLGLLTISSTAAFGALCEAWAAMMVAKRRLRKTKTSDIEPFSIDRTHGGELRKHPGWMVYCQASDKYLALTREFGGTPSSLVGLPAPEAGDDQDGIEDLFGS